MRAADEFIPIGSAQSGIVRAARQDPPALQDPSALPVEMAKRAARRRATECKVQAVTARQDPPGLQDPPALPVEMAKRAA